MNASMDGWLQPLHASFRHEAFHVKCVVRRASHIQESLISLITLWIASTFLASAASRTAVS